MFRKAFCLGLIGLLLSQAPVWADTGGRPSALAPESQFHDETSGLDPGRHRRGVCRRVVHRPRRVRRLDQQRSKGVDERHRRCGRWRTGGRVDQPQRRPWAAGEEHGCEEPAGAPCRSRRGRQRGCRHQMMMQLRRRVRESQRRRVARNARCWFQLRSTLTARFRRQRSISAPMAAIGDANRLPLSSAGNVDSCRSLAVVLALTMSATACGSSSPSAPSPPPSTGALQAPTAFGVFSQRVTLTSNEIVLDWFGTAPGYRVLIGSRLQRQRRQEHRRLR